MNDLKENVINVVDANNQDWVKTIRDAEEKRKGIDLSEMMSRFSGRMKDLDRYFRDFEERNRKNKKKRWI